QPGQHAGEEALRDRALDADRRDRPDRRREAEAHDEPFDEEIHRGMASVSFGHRGSLLGLARILPCPGRGGGRTEACFYGSKISSISLPKSLAMRKASGRLGS